MKITLELDISDELPFAAELASGLVAHPWRLVQARACLTASHDTHALMLAPAERAADLACCAEQATRLLSAVAADQIVAMIERASSASLN